MISGVKYAPTGEFPNGRRKGNWLFLDNGHLGGSTSDTGFYTAIQPPEGGYTLYINKETGGPSIYTFSNGDELLNFCNGSLGANQPTVDSVREWLLSQNGYFLDPEYGSSVFAFQSTPVEEPPIFTYTSGNEPSSYSERRYYTQYVSEYISMNGGDMVAGIAAFNSDNGNKIESSNIYFSYTSEPPSADKENWEFFFWMNISDMNAIMSAQWFVDAKNNFENNSSAYGGKVNVSVPMQYYTAIPIGYGGFSNGSVINWGDGTTSTYNGTDDMVDFCAHYYDIPGPFNITTSQQISFDVGYNEKPYPFPYVPYNSTGKILQFGNGGDNNDLNIATFDGFPGVNSGIVAENIPPNPIQTLFFLGVDLPNNISGYTFVEQCDVTLDNITIDESTWEVIITEWANNIPNSGSGIFFMPGLPINSNIQSAYTTLGNKGYSVFY